MIFYADFHCAHQKCLSLKKSMFFKKYLKTFKKTQRNIAQYVVFYMSDRISFKMTLQTKKRVVPRSKMGQKSSKMVENGSKKVQNGPKWVKHGRKWSHMGQKRSKMLQNGVQNKSKMVQNNPKTVQKAMGNQVKWGPPPSPNNRKTSCGGLGLFLNRF